MTRPSVDREEALERMVGRPLDVLVVGGGITGAGVALDASSRGYRVGLLERDDIASGTSSRSSKLVHGGLRYLADGDLAMVVESVRERDRNRRAAPHLVRPLAFAVATSSPTDRAMLKAGLLAYDAIGAGRAVARHSRLSPAALARDAPTLRARRDGGYRYWDARTDDARLTLAVVQAARAHGALVATHASVDEVTGTVGGRVTGVTFTDRLGDRRGVVRARWVVAAGGAWAGELRDRAPTGAWSPAVRPARGAHLVLPRTALPVRSAVVFGSGTADGRRLFAVPWGDQVYVGTNDVPSDDLAATVTDDDVAYLLGALAAAFEQAPTRSDVIAGWAGVRPLVGAGAATADISRRHLVVEDPDGLVHVTSGKLTTWRAMAEEVVDHLTDVDGRRVRCRTTRSSLGAAGSTSAGASRVRTIGASLGVAPGVSAQLYARHGDAAPRVMLVCREVDGGFEPLVDGLPYLRGEVAWAVRHELARTVADVLARRTRVSLRDRRAGLGADAPAVVEAMIAEELGRMVGDDHGAAAYLAQVRRDRGVLADPVAAG